MLNQVLRKVTSRLEKVNYISDNNMKQQQQQQKTRHGLKYLAVNPE